MGKHIIWALALVAAVAAIADGTSKYSIEETKQRAFMMKACVEAGGEWNKNYGLTWDCIRPKGPRP